MNLMKSSKLSSETLTNTLRHDSIYNIRNYNNIFIKNQSLQHYNYIMNILNRDNINYDDDIYWLLDWMRALYKNVI